MIDTKKEKVMQRNRKKQGKQGNTKKNQESLDKKQYKTTKQQQGG